MKFDIFDKSSGYFYANGFAALAAWNGYTNQGRGIVRAVRYGFGKIGFAYVAASGINNELKTVSATKKDKGIIRKLLKTYNPRQEFIVIDSSGYAHMKTEQELWWHYDQVITNIMESGFFAHETPLDYLDQSKFVAIRSRRSEEPLSDDTQFVTWYTPALKVTKNFAAHWADLTCKEMLEVGITDRRNGIILCLCLPDKKDQVLEILESSSLNYDSITQRERIKDILDTMKDDGLTLDLGRMKQYSFRTLDKTRKGND